MEPISTGFVTFPPGNGLFYVDDDGSFRTLVFGFTADNALDLPAEHTHFGVVVSGEIEVIYPGRRRSLLAGDFFSVKLTGSDRLETKRQRKAKGRSG